MARKPTPKFACRICAAAVTAPPPIANPTWVLCSADAGIAKWDSRQWLAAKQIAEMVDREQLDIVVDPANNLWLSQKPPPTPKPQAVSYDDDGFPRYLDTASPHGVTPRPGHDHGIGSNGVGDGDMDYKVVVNDPPPGANNDGK
jgi:hypothetical protein